MLSGKCGDGIRGRSNLLKKVKSDCADIQNYTSHKNQEDRGLLSLLLTCWWSSRGPLFFTFPRKIKNQHFVPVHISSTTSPVGLHFIIRTNTFPDIGLSLSLHDSSSYTSLYFMISRS